MESAVIMDLAVLYNENGTTHLRFTGVIQYLPASCVPPPSSEIAQTSSKLTYMSGSVRQGLLPPSSEARAR